MQQYFCQQPTWFGLRAVPVQRKVGRQQASLQHAPLQSPLPQRADNRRNLRGRGAGKGLPQGAVGVLQQAERQQPAPLLPQRRRHRRLRQRPTPSRDSGLRAGRRQRGRRLQEHGQQLLRLILRRVATGIVGGGTKQRGCHAGSGEGARGRAQGHGCPPRTQRGGRGVDRHTQAQRGAAAAQADEDVSRAGGGGAEEARAGGGQRGGGKWVMGLARMHEPQPRVQTRQ